MKSIIFIIATALVLFSIANGGFIRSEAPASTIHWFGITEPGSRPEPVLDTDYVSEPVDTPTLPEGMSPTSLSASERGEIAERTRTYMSRRYPPIIILHSTIPDGADDANKVIIEANLSFIGGVKPTYCIQLIPIRSDAPDIIASATVYDAQKLLDNNYAISATPDPDGIFRFDITSLIPLITSGEVANTFIVKPFMPKDKFEIPELTSNPFTLVMWEEI